MAKVTRKISTATKEFNKTLKAIRQHGCAIKMTRGIITAGSPAQHASRVWNASASAAWSMKRGAQVRGAALGLAA